MSYPNRITSAGDTVPHTTPARILPEIPVGGTPQPRVLPTAEALAAPIYSPIRNRHGDLLSGRRARRIEARVTRREGGRRW
ncbi:MAG: hypothetical protein AB7R89_11075 [Dehalococcoidia bacterium]